MLADETVETSRRERDAAACDKLLALLRRHHGVTKEPINVEAIQAPAAIIVEPEPMPETVEAGWVERQKTIWFSMEPEKKTLNVEIIQAEVAKEYGLKRRDLLTAKRTHNVAFPRQVAMYLSKTMLGKSLPDIGRRFGGRDHTTVLHAVRKIERMVQKDENLLVRVQSLTARLQP